MFGKIKQLIYRFLGMGKKENTDNGEFANVHQTTIKGILKTLDQEYEAAKKRDNIYCADTSVVKTVKGFGATVLPHDFDFAILPEIDKTKPLPSVIYLTNIFGTLNGASGADVLPADSFYALKKKKSIWVSSGVVGVYDFGVRYRANDQERSAYKNLWLGGIAHIKEDGTVCFPKEKRLSFAKVITKKRHKQKWSKLNKGANIETVKNISWVEQPLVEQIMTDTGKSKEKTQHDLGMLINSMFRVNSFRSNYWRVSTKRGKTRLHFLINQQNPKILFKDRDIKGLTKTGKKKTIIHYVSEHERRLPNGGKTTVKEHLRGLSRFGWNGYDCKIIAPKLSKINIDDFSIGSVDPAEGNGRCLSGKKTMKLLHDVESMA